MTNNDYLRPGLVAIALAFIYPTYWIFEIGYGDFSVFDEDYIREIRLTIADWAFLIIGAMLVYVFLGLKRILADQLNFHGIDLLLNLMIGFSAIYYGGIFLMELVLLVSGESLSSTAQEGIIVVFMVVTFGYIVIGGLLEILIGVFLIREFNLLPSLLKIFAIAILITGLCDITVLFSFAGLFLFPVTLLILAMHFMLKPDMIEVV